MKKCVFVSAVLSCLIPIPVFAESTEDLIKQGDAAARVYNEEEALKYYLAALKQDPENVYLYVAVSKEYRHLMSDSDSDRDKLRYGNTALEHAERAAALGPRDSEAQLAPAITRGKLLPLLSGSKEKLETSRAIKSAADRAVALDPKNDTAWHILGRWHKGVAEIGGLKRAMGGAIYGSLPKSTYENSAACFEKAVEIAPRRAMHHIELGCVYAEMKMDAGAKAAIERGLALPDTEKDDPETKADGREVLRKLQ